MWLQQMVEPLKIQVSSWLDYVTSLPKTTKTIAAATAVIIVVAWSRRKRHRLPPGPTPLPLLGNLLALRKKSIVDQLKEWKKKYGPVFTFYAGPRPIFVISDVDSMNQAFVHQGYDFSGRPFVYSADLMTEGSKDIALADYGETWKYQRKMAAQALRQYATGDQLELRVHETLLPIIDAIKAEKGAFDPHHYLFLSVFNVIHGICFGNTFTLDDPLFIKLVDILDTFTAQSGNGFVEDFIFFYRWWPTKRFTKIIKVVDEFNEYMNLKLNEHKLHLSSSDACNLTDKVLLAYEKALQEEPAKAELLDNTHLAQIIADVFGAGVDTSRMTLDWVFLLLGVYPDQQKKLHEEIDSVVGNGFPGRTHRPKLLLTESFLMEAMRLYNAVPMSLPHKTTQDTSVAGYEIPSGSMVIPFLHGILRDPKYCEDPLQFKPERFLNKDGTKLEMKEKGWVPFSIGQRSCIGESLAKLELVYIIAGLLQELEFSLPPGVKPNLEPLNPGIQYIPHRYQVIVKPRN